jgi:photosystem II stability/assembly factor-like uncharacterized protein
MKKLLIILPLTLLILLAFTTPLNLTNGWYQQFMPNLGGRTINDITFLDSLTGYAVTNKSSDTSYFLKTTNAGNDWQIIYRQYYELMTSIQFINDRTGFAGGSYVFKTTNGGYNWSIISSSLAVSALGIYALNQDTIWMVTSIGSGMGWVFRTTNSGINWSVQYTGGVYHIYMYNARIGFIDGLKKTTNGGENWNPIAPGEPSLFFDMHFVDSLTGWKATQLMKKTTDGGLTWVNQPLPTGGSIVSNYLTNFSNVNKDTIWGVGGAVYLGGGQYRGIIFKTTNGGTNWGFQLPDTAIHITGEYKYCVFVNKLNGWAYNSSYGVHTNDGGNDTTYTFIKAISSVIPDQFKLYQNYPNPFNPKTIISYELRITSYVLLSVYDITGKHIIDLVNQKQNSGEYEIDFNGANYSS